MINAKKRNTVENAQFMNEEEVPETFGEILDNVRLRKELMTYLQTKLAEENLLFYESVIRFKKLPTVSLRNKIGREMVVKFIADESLYWVNLSHDAQTDLLAVEDFEEDTFDNACAEIERLMSANFFESFKKYLVGKEEERKAKTSSFESWKGLLGTLNAAEDEEIDLPDCGCAVDTENEICCSKRKEHIGNFVASKAKGKGWRGSIMNQKMFNSVLGKSTTNVRGAVMSPTKKRAKNAFRRIFHKEKPKRGPRMSFWADDEL